MENHEINSSVIEGIHYATGELVTIEVIDGLIDNIFIKDGMPSVGGNLIIAPGLIDNQINGYAGIDFSGPALSAEDAIKAAVADLKSKQPA